MDLKEQLVIWKRAEFLVDNMAWTPQLVDSLLEEGILTASMLADIHSRQTHVEMKLHFLTLLGTHNIDVFKKFLRALKTSKHGALAQDIQRMHRLTKFGEMLPPMFTYFLDLSEFLRKYPHIGLKLGEDGKHILQCFIEGKISVEIRKNQENLETLERTNKKLLAKMAAMEKRMEETLEKQKAAEELWATSGDQIDDLNQRINELEIDKRVQQQEIRHLKHFFHIQNDLEDFTEKEYKEYIGTPMVSVKATDIAINSNRDLNISEKERHTFHLLQSKVRLNIVSLDLLRTNLQNFSREEKRVQSVLKSVQKNSKADASVRKEACKFLEDIRTTKSQLESQLSDGELDLAKHEKELAEKEKDYKVPSEISVRTHTDLIAKLKAIIENLKLQHSRKLHEQIMKHKREMDDMFTRIQNMNTKHMEEVEKLKGTIRKKMFEIHKREQLHKKLRGQIRVMENYQARNMNATVSVEQCRKIVRAIIGEARILRDIADEKDSVMQQAEQEAERKMDQKENPYAKKDRKGKNGNKNKKKRKIPACLNEERFRYLAEKIRYDWRGLGILLGLTENRLDIVEMDVGTGNAERTAYCMLRVWRDEEAGTPSELALALLEMGQDRLATLILPMIKLQALKQAMQAGDNLTDDEDNAELYAPSTARSSVPSLPQIRAN